MSFSLDGSALDWPTGGIAVIRQPRFERDRAKGGLHAYIAELSIDREDAVPIHGKLRFTDGEYVCVPGDSDDEKATEILKALRSFVSSNAGLQDGFYVDVVTDGSGVHVFPR